MLVRANGLRVLLIARNELLCFVKIMIVDSFIRKRKILTGPLIQQGTPGLNLLKDIASEERYHHVRLQVIGFDKDMPVNANTSAHLTRVLLEIACEKDETPSHC